MDRQPVTLGVTHVLDILSGNDDAPAGRNIRARNHFEQRGLARAIRPHDTDNFGAFEAAADAQLKGRRLVEKTPAIDLFYRIERQQRCVHARPPRSRRFKAGSSRNVAASPFQTTRPCDSTTTWSATERAISAFCSTTMLAISASLSPRITRSTSSTIFGASPWLGSSNRTRPGEPSNARRNRDHLHLASRECFGLARHQVFERRENLTDLIEGPGAK